MRPTSPRSTQAGGELAGLSESCRIPIDALLHDSWLQQTADLPSADAASSRSTPKLQNPLHWLGPLLAWQTGMKRWHLVTLVSFPCALWLLAAAFLDVAGHQQLKGGTWDAVVVAGCRVDPGGTPSLALQGRTALAVELWGKGLAPVVLFTGGVGDYPPAEAVAAAAYAETLGLPRDAILTETRSTSTEQNAQFAAELLGSGRILVVTDSYHVWRAERVFSRHFESATGVGRTPLPLVRTRGALREVAAVAWYGVNGRL